MTKKKRNAQKQAQYEAQQSEIQSKNEMKERESDREEEDDDDEEEGNEDNNVKFDRWSSHFSETTKVKLMNDYEIVLFQDISVVDEKETGTSVWDISRIIAHGITTNTINFTSKNSNIFRKKKVLELGAGNISYF